MDPEELEQDPDVFAQEGPGLFTDAPARSGAPEEEEPLALYRRYRPEVFSEIIGQEHVTEPLKRALANNRVNHAYLFSGPRGCGKTSSARILARSLNCEKGPTPDPCGVCQSCRDLGRGGPGSIDVIEIDAASHGGVDDARDLRERAFFAPVHSRYKIYIVDEAHMVTSAGFNALLKLVEEPPPHVKFIFATTEPDKVIGTIRSRTHHYPFRLIPPKTMTAYLTKICEEEHMRVEPGVLAMVVRAGGGSVRDSLSILDQLFGGAAEDGVEYEQAAALLGYTPDSLLDSVVDAIAASDSRGVFSGVDKVIESGQDPRRFTEDLLARLRDLVIVAAVPDALSSGLLDVSDDQGERLVEQAKGIGIGSLTRAAEVLAQGLVAMRGTTTPRLQLELMCARILLPGSDTGERGLLARVEKLEHRLDAAGPGTGTSGGAAIAPPGPPPAQRADAGPSGPAGRPVPRSGEPAPSGSAEAPRTTEPAPSSRPSPAEPGPSPVRAGPSPVEPTPNASPAPSSAGPPSPPQLTIEDVRNGWPRILSRVSATRRYVWMILNQYANLTDLRGTVLWVTFSEAGARDNFNRSSGEEYLAQAIQAELGVDLHVRARLESEPIPADGTAILSLAKPVPEPNPRSAPRATEPGRGAAMSGHSAEPHDSAAPEPQAVPNPGSDQARGKPKPRPKKQPPIAEDDAPSEDDPVVENPADQAAELVMELFGAELVDEEKTKP